MRETEILRGLHKARCAVKQGGKNFADGMVPAPARPVSAFSLKGMYQNAVSGTSSLMEKALTPAPKPQAPAPVTAAPAAPAPEGGMTTLQDAVGAIKTRHETMKNLSSGTAFLEGPGTGKSDSIHDVSLSRGEAVLPAKTVQAVGVENLARLIQDTNDGIPPKGLRAGGKYSGGSITIGGVQMPSADDLDLQRVPHTAAPTPAQAPVAQPAAPAAAPYTPPRIDPTTGKYAMGTAAPVSPAATPVAAAPAAAPAPTPGLRGRMGRGYDAVKSALSSGGEAAAGGAKTLAGKVTGALGTAAAVGGVGVGAALEGASVAEDLKTPGMTREDTLPRIGEGAGRVAGAYVGGAKGAALGSVAGPAGAVVGGLAGGALGYFAPDAANSAVNWAREKFGMDDNQLRSEKAAGLRARAATTQPVAAATPAAVQPVPVAGVVQPVSAQAPATPALAPAPRAVSAQDRTDSDAALASVLGRRAGGVANENVAQNVRTLAGDSASRDKVNAAWAQRGAGVQAVSDGKGGLMLTDSTGAENMRYTGLDGKPTNDYRATGQYAEGMQNREKLLGAAAAVDQRNAESSAVQQSAAVGHINEQHATSQREQARQSAGLKASLTGDPSARRQGEARLAALDAQDAQRAVHSAESSRQALTDTTTRRGQDITKEAALLGLQSAQRKHDTPSGDAILQAGVATDKARAAAAQTALEGRAAGSEALDKQFAMDPYAQGTDDKGNSRLDTAKQAALADYVARSGRKVNIGGNEVDMSTAMRLHPQHAKKALAAMSGELSLHDLAKNSGNMWFKTTPKAGDIELAEPVGNVNWKDYENGMGVGQMAWEKAFGSGVVRLKGPNNKIVSLPLSDIDKSPNAASMRQALNEVIARSSKQK